MDGPKLVIQQADNLDWYWHAVAGNGEIVCQGEGHTSSRDALRAARSAVAALATAFDLGAIEYR